MEVGRSQKAKQLFVWFTCKIFCLGGIAEWKQDGGREQQTCNLSTHSDVFDSQRFQHCCRSIARYFPLSLVSAVYLWNKTGPEYCRRSSESLESSCGNAKRNCRPLPAEYREHPAAAMFVFFVPSTRNFRAKAVYMVLGSSWLTARKILALGPSTTPCM